MANTFELIASSTVGSGGTSGITFSSIPQTYTDLLLKVSFRTNRPNENDYLRIIFNSSSSYYGDYNIYKSDATISSEFGNSTTYGFSYGLNGNTSTSNTFGNTEIYIPSYTASTNKPYSAEGVTENNASFNQMALTALRWNSTAAITDIYLASHDAAKTLLQYSTAYLYGVKNA
jgi:hypothetical protein